MGRPATAIAAAPPRATASRSPVAPLLGALDALSRWLGGASMVLLAALVVTMTVEVISRRLLGAPTQWAYDVSTMTHGAMFVLAFGFVLQQRRHVTIDFLSERLPARVRDGIEAAFFGIVLVPLLGVVVQVAWREAWEAFETGRLDRVSPWAPRVWPYLTALAAGLTGLLLQSVAVALCAAAGAFGTARAERSAETAE